MNTMFHSKRETAAILGVSVRTLENLVAMREISPRHIGRRVLFDEREIERFARRDHRTKPQHLREGHHEDLERTAGTAVPAEGREVNRNVATEFSI